MNNSCEEDEEFLKEIGNSNPFTQEVFIFDARTKINANANRFVGGGLENYSQWTIWFGNIEGIHYVNSAYKSLMKSCHKTSKLEDLKFFNRIDHSGWYNTISKIMYFSLKASEIMHKDKQNVLIHWADGWDRTTMLCSLIQIYLDPFYRTIRGLEVLIEKDWISFGHKFEDRSGHFKSHNYNSKERAPVFISFWDWLFQLISQFPHSFEYNNTLLLFLSHHVYTCKFGTFLFDHDRDRNFMEIRSKTISIWDFVNSNLDSFKNIFYEGREGRISPNTWVASLKFWREHFLMYTKLSGYHTSHSDCQAPYDHREKLYKEALEEIRKLKLKDYSVKSFLEK